MNKTLTLVVLTYNSEKKLNSYLESLQNQSIKPDKLLCIDSSSKDKTRDVCNKYGFDVITIKQEDFDHGYTRTLAAKNATSDIIVFTTHDIIFSNKDSLKNLLACFSDEKIAAAYGRQLPFSDATFFSKALRSFNYPNESHIRTYLDKNRYGFKTAFLSDSYCAYNRILLKEAGYFASPIIFGEDTEIAARFLQRGYKIAYIADALVFHSHNYNVTQEFQRYFDTGVFHKQYFHLIEKFGKPEGAGFKYVLSEIKSLLRSNRTLLIPYAMIRNFVKYLGYKIGQNYLIFPKSINKLFSMNKGYWK